MRTEIDDLTDVVERTEGASAAFLKELGRRATFVAAESSDADKELVVTHAHLVEALDDLLEHSTPILLATLGAAPDRAGPTDSPFSAFPMPMMGGPRTGGMMTHLTLGGAHEVFDEKLDDPLGE
jgi:hypothetical protein